MYAFFLILMDPWWPKTTGDFWSSWDLFSSSNSRLKFDHLINKKLILNFPCWKYVAFEPLSWSTISVCRPFPLTPQKDSTTERSVQYPQNISTTCKDVEFQHQSGRPSCYAGLNSIEEPIRRSFFCFQARLCSSLASDPEVFVEGARTLEVTLFCGYIAN